MTSCRSIRDRCNGPFRPSEHNRGVQGTFPAPKTRLRAANASFWTIAMLHFKAMMASRMAGRVEPQKNTAMLDPRDNPFIEQVKADLAEGQAELDRGERIPWHEVLANLDADAQQRLTERDIQPPI